MRYIKSYKLFESENYDGIFPSENVLDTINDVLEDMSDEGYEVEVSPYWQNRRDFTVRIDYNSEIYWDHVREYIYRLIDTLKGEGIKLDGINMGTTTHKTLDDLDNSTHECESNELFIYLSDNDYIVEAKKSKVKEAVPTEYFTMEHILDILQDFVDDEKVDIPSDPERHGYNPRQTNPYWTSLRFLKTIDCLQTYVNGKQYVSWQTFDEVRQTLEKWNVKNCFGNSDKDWRSEYYIYNPIIEQSFAKLVGECKAYPSGDNIATFYVGKGDICHFIAVNNGEESEYQIGSNKHFLISSQIWDHFTSVYCLDTKSTQRLLKHLVGRYFNLKMDGNLMWPDKYGYVIGKKDTQKIYKENMGIDEKIYLKTYEGYHEDDVNAHLTSTVIDIFQELVEDSDFEVDCFTVGYKTLRDAGVTFSDNDIALYIGRDWQEHEVDMSNTPKYKLFTLSKIIPYINRTVEYMKSEGKPVNVISYQYRMGKSKLKQVDLKTLDELLSLDPNLNIESLHMDFGTGHFSAPGCS